MIHPRLLNTLCCPETRSELILDGDALISVDSNSRRKYFIRNGIPDMLIEESIVLGQSEWKAIMLKHNRPVQDV